MKGDKELKKDVNHKRKKNLPQLDQSSIIHLIMLLLTIIVYVVFLTLQQFLFSFEGLRNKIIIINVLLATGLAIEIIYFIWEIRKKQRKAQKNIAKENNNSKSDE